MNVLLPEPALPDTKNVLIDPPKPFWEARSGRGPCSYEFLFIEYPFKRFVLSVRDRIVAYLSYTRIKGLQKVKLWSTVVIVVEVTALEIDVPIIVTLEVCASIHLSVLILVGPGTAYRV